MPFLGVSVSGWLHRPYLDLGPAPAGVPNHTAALLIDCRSLFENEETPWFWSSLNPSFREVLAADVGLAGYDVRTPLDLAPELRTDRWQQLCDLVSGFDGLTTETQVKVARMLNRMCFFSCTRAMIPATAVSRAPQGESASMLAWLRAFAGYKMWLDGDPVDYDLSEFEALAEAAPPGLAKINPLYQMVVQNVKVKGDLGATEYWQERHAAAIEAARKDLDEHDYLMALSRSHRVAGFIPQMKRDEAGTVREMDLAEEYARRMDFGTELQRAYAKELAYPVGESRVKEALWIGDLDLALQRATAHRDAHLLDARVWVQCGEVHVQRDELEEALRCFQEGIRLSPPGGEVARFLAGQCHEQLGDPNAALDCYLGALRVDPLGIGSAEGALRVAEQLGSGVLTWTRETLHRLEELSAQHEDTDGAYSYRNLPAPIERGAS